MSTISQYPSLSTPQRNLLAAALASNKRNKTNPTAPQPQVPDYFPQFTAPQKIQQTPYDSVNPAIFDLNQSSINYDSTFDDSLLSLDGNNPIDFGLVQPSPNGLDIDAHEKRKSPDDDEEDDEDDYDHKKQEGDDKVAKKPGRKLITAEPTTKRKAQNRAAQRAFRERKEKHLKDMELKVADLEKTSENTSQENGILKAQIKRLQAELAEYKKRLSSSAGLAGSPPNAAFPSFANTSRGSTGASDFQFDFTKFGQNSSFRHMSTGTSASNNSASNTNTQTRQNSRSLSPSQYNSLNTSWTGLSNDASFPSTTLQATTTNSNGGNGSFLGNLANLGNINFDANQLDMNTSAQATSCPSLCHDDTRSSGASPCASTPLDPFTSEETSPTPITSDTAQSTKAVDNLAFDFSNYTDDQGFGQFANTTTNNFDFGIDWLANQNGGQFDPVLFSDYRESQDAIIGAGDFSGGLFDDSFGMPGLPNNFSFDMSPQNFNATPSPAKTTTTTKQPTLLERVDACRNGDIGEHDGLVIPTEDKNAAKDAHVSDAHMLTAHKIWSELQSCPKFKSGELDIDSLCTELSKKATCSETGLQVPRDVVEATLWKLVGDDEEAGQLMSRVKGAHKPATA